MENRPPLPARPSAEATFNPGTGRNTPSAWDRDSDTHNPPPPYYSPSSAPVLVHSQISDAGPRQSRILPKPCVVPQTSHTLHGSIYRPFARAYAPDLGDHGISASDFLAFIDGLNEVWLAHPYLQATSAASSLLGFLPLLETQLVAVGVQVAAEYGSVKVSQLRTQAYMKLANEQLFAPRRLRAQVLTTKVMMEEVGIPGEVLELAPVSSKRDEEGDDVFADTEGDAGEGSSSGKGAKEVKGGSERKYDPQMRRLEAIRDYVLPLTFADALPLSDNWLKRASEKQERVFSEKQNTRLAERREKAAKLAAEAEAIQRELASQLEEVEALKTAARDRANERLQGPLGESMQGQLIVQEDLEKEMKKLNKKTDKLVKEGEKKIGKKLQKSEKRIERAEKREAKIAQKVMWIVVTGDDGRGFQDHLWEDLDC
ncbi:hypothetical protein ATEIFO6365_0014026400 [Aspergillus terreus]|uniref:Uncharacterized protein n=1 Tax=Aspergillus terreus TaxID=33178 RepID=A0A5M3Z4Y3_ASPTE|nr:hypothetical protein ATETN484_0008050400 [Aspergillus terreus]GFF21332.1 hypothetical protein ATEIFO6365_0014026400 [Aspergillus terreus]